MKRQWSFFIGAAILAALFLINAGAPLVAVAAGVAGAAVFMVRKSRAT